MRSTLPCRFANICAACYQQSRFSLPPPTRLCFRCCLSVCLLATLRKNFWTDMNEIPREGWQWTNEQVVKIWWRSGSRIRIRIRIATLVRRALAEVCTVPVLPVMNVLYATLRMIWNMLACYEICNCFTFIVNRWRDAKTRRSVLPSSAQNQDWTSLIVVAFHYYHCWYC